MNYKYQVGNLSSISSPVSSWVNWDQVWPISTCASECSDEPERASWWALQSHASSRLDLQILNSIWPKQHEMKRMGRKVVDKSLRPGWKAHLPVAWWLNLYGIRQGINPLVRVDEDRNEAKFVLQGRTTYTLYLHELDLNKTSCSWAGREDTTVHGAIWEDMINTGQAGHWWPLWGGSRFTSPQTSCLWLRQRGGTKIVQKVKQEASPRNSDTHSWVYATSALICTEKHLWAPAGNKSWPGHTRIHSHLIPSAAFWEQQWRLWWSQGSLLHLHWSVHTTSAWNHL